MSHTHWLDRQDDGDLTIVRFHLHRLTDDDDTREAFAMLQQLVEAMGRKKLIVNFSEVDYLASLAVAKIVMLNRRVEAAGGRLALCGMSERLRNVFKITHLDDLLKIVASEEEARTAVTNSASECV